MKLSETQIEQIRENVSCHFAEADKRNCLNLLETIDALKAKNAALQSKIGEARKLAEKMPHTAAPNLDPDICANSYGPEKCDKCDLLAVLGKESR